SRKEVLVAYGFRLPSALDNRPLNFEEWEARIRQVVFVSATPGPYELAKSQGVVVEQIIRPTGLIDPPIDVRPVKGQVDDLLQEIRVRVERHERVLVTTLTKRMAEDLTQYYHELGVRVRYLHSDIETNAMRTAISETARRRALQEAYNREHGITPQSIVKQIDDVMSSVYERDYMTPAIGGDGTERFRTQAELDAYIASLQEQMRS